MKQKAAQVKAKTNLNQVQNKNVKNQKIEQNVAVEQIKEEEVSPQAKNATRGRGKQQKSPVKAELAVKEEPLLDPKEEEAELEGSENAEDSGADVEADEHVTGGADDDYEEGDDAEDDEGPTEASIERDGNGIPKIHSGPIPKDIAFEQIIYVQNLPKKGSYKQADLVEVFGKYGTLHTIKPSYRAGDEHLSTAVIAFTTAEAANAALAADGAQVKGSTIKVTLKKPLKKEQLAAERKKAYEERKKLMEESKDRMLYVKNVKPGTSEDDIRNYFSQCGEVEAVNAISRKQFTYAFVIFKDSEPVQEALKLHNTTLNGATIGVYLHGDESSRASAKDPKRTVYLKNVQQLESVCGQKIDAIFSPCGEIEDIDILCRKNVLAFITFKDEESVQKALELNETEAEGLQIEVGEYRAPTERQKTAVFMQNVKPGTSEDEIRELFANTGEIDHVYMKGTFAIIKFTDTDGFCKSFLLNETNLSGQPIFLEPYSDRKQAILRKKQPLLGGKRRSGSFHRGGNKKFKGNSN